MRRGLRHYWRAWSYAWAYAWSDDEWERRQRARALLHALTEVDLAVARMEPGRTRQMLQGCADQLHKAFPLLTER